MRDMRGRDRSDRSERYWGEYSNLQRVKHDLIRHYLNGWFPKLGLGPRAGRILYIDTHAGRGRHLTGELGSPLVALTAFLAHRSRDRILARSEVVFIFIERDEANFAALQREIAALGPVPDRVVIDPRSGDAFEVLRQTVLTLRRAGQGMAPAFIFVDPYGFEVPCSVLKDLLAFKGVELFVTLMWRELNMAIRQATKKAGMARAVDLVFDGPAWRDRIVGPRLEDRANQALALLKEKVGAKWATDVRMRAKNRVTRYVLRHLTNSDDGRVLMKDVAWKLCPDGDFDACKAASPDQQILPLEPDLTPLRYWVTKQLHGHPKRWQELVRLLVGEDWREPQLNAVIREMLGDTTILPSDYQGSRTPKANPLLSLAPRHSRSRAPGDAVR